MIPLERLILVAGFDGPNFDRQISEAERSLQSGTTKFVARRYPSNTALRAEYLRKLVYSANDVIFGKGAATNFCRRQDQPCSMDVGKNKSGSKSCDRSRSTDAACARGRPKIVIVLCADRVFPEVLDRLGRGTLIHRLAGPELPPADELQASLKAFEPIAAAVILAVANRDKTLYAPLVPDRNFQRLGLHPIAADVQAAPADFDSIMQSYHNRLYSGAFKNPEKPKIRGAYMLDENVAFQQDRLHNTVQIMGPDSRKDGFHLLNAYHIYGVKTDPGFHFDVMDKAGGPIGRTLIDVLTGKAAGNAEDHLNATPCDRLL